jgi:SAM-dependent methyltransferase
VVGTGSLAALSGATVDAALLEYLRCPFCRARLDERDDASLECTGCGRRFKVEHGIPLMLHEELPGAREKLGEAAGWLEKARAEGWYEPDDETDKHLPFVTRDLGWEDSTWIANEYSFQALLDDFVGGRRGLRVLEVGAAKAWAAPFWRERGCEYVATDILVDPNIGLGRGAFFGEFARVQADGEHLPFADASFDVAYCIATLHHALDLRAMVGEMARVTKPGGVVAGLNEGTRGVLRSGENPDQEAEKALGINEHVHTVWTYLASFRRAGLRTARVERSDGRPPESPGGKLVRLPIVGPRLAILVHLSHKPYGGVTIFSRRR